MINCTFYYDGTLSSATDILLNLCRTVNDNVFSRRHWQMAAGMLLWFTASWRWHPVTAIHWILL